SRTSWSSRCCGATACRRPASVSRGWTSRAGTRRSGGSPSGTRRRDAEDLHGRARTERADRSGEGGKPEPTSLRADEARPGADRAYGRGDAGDGGRRPGGDEVVVQPDEARWRGAPEDALVAGAHAPQPALRHRHQGPGRVEDLLRAARVVRSRRQSRPDARGRSAEPPERSGREGRDVGHLATQEERRL